MEEWAGLGVQGWTGQWLAVGKEAGIAGLVLALAWAAWLC